MYKVYAITHEAVLIKVGILSGDDCLPTSVHNLAILYCVSELDTAVGLARRLANSLGSCSDKIVYMASSRDGEPLYVGMGREDRHLHLTSGASHVKEANEYDGEMIVEVLHQGLTKKEASKIEHRLIAELKPKWNKNSGGVVDAPDHITEVDDIVKNHRVKPKPKPKPKISKPKKSTNEYVFRPEDHMELYRELFAIGDGSHKSGDMNKLVFQSLGNYVSKVGDDFGKYVSNGGWPKYKNTFETVSGKALRRFLRNLGMEVSVSQKRVDGVRHEFSKLSVKSYIIDRSIKEVEQQETDSMALAREDLKQFKVVG